MQFFRKGLEEVITLPAPHIPDIDEVEEVKRIVAARTASDVKSVMDHGSQKKGIRYFKRKFYRYLPKDN